MGVFRVAAFAAMTSLAFLPSVAEASSACWYPNEAKAAQVRGLQTMLMVGTLQCRRSYRASEYLYNDFVRSQRGFLDANAQVLKAHFMRENGIDGGQNAYDRFGTSLANQYSEQLDDRAFCETVHHYARLAADATREELIELAEVVAEAPQSGICRPSQYQFDRPARDDGADDYARREPPPPPRIAISDGTEVRPAVMQQALNAPPAPEPEVQVAAAPEPEPQPEAAAAPEPVPAVQLAAAEEPAPAPVPAEAKVELIEQVKADVAVAQAGPGREEALQAAILALQSAVVALQAASATSGEPGPVKSVDVPGAGTK